MTRKYTFEHKVILVENGYLKASEIKEYESQYGLLKSVSCNGRTVLAI